MLVKILMRYVHPGKLVSEVYANQKHILSPEIFLLIQIKMALKELESQIIREEELQLVFLLAVLQVFHQVTILSQIYQIAHIV